MSRNPVAIEPGRYTVILEPQAVGDLVQLLAFALGARAADEGRSAFSKAGGGTKVGEKIVDERVSLLSDPADPQLLTNAFDGQGLPARRQVWIENGVLKKLTYSRFWAQKKNQQPDAGTNAVKLVGGTQSREDLIASTPRGILVTRLWYLRPVIRARCSTPASRATAHFSSRTARSRSRSRTCGSTSHHSSCSTISTRSAAPNGSPEPKREVTW